jgi:hypothetical protein
MILKRRVMQCNTQPGRQVVIVRFSGGFLGSPGAQGRVCLPHEQIADFVLIF